MTAEVSSTIAIIQFKREEIKAVRRHSATLPYAQDILTEQSVSTIIPKTGILAPRRRKRQDTTASFNLTANGCPPGD